MKTVVFILSLALCTLCLTGCSYTPATPQSAAGSAVGGTGGIKYDHQYLGAGKHMLVVTAAPGFMETESSIAQRIHIFATKFAASTCPEGYTFIDDPNFDQQVAGGFMKRTRTYVFVKGWSPSRSQTSPGGLSL